MKFTTEELEYLLSRMRISCPSDGIMHKRIENKISAEIQERNYEADINIH